MARRNRVDPWGDLHAVTAHGLFTGNRGCLVDDDRRIVRHHRGALWIVCQVEFRGRRHPLDEPRRWTPLFFLDEAVALAAGHRPCGYCRRGAYLAYRDAVTSALGAERPLKAIELNRRLAVERLRRGRGLDRAAHRIVTRRRLADLPDGAVVRQRDLTGSHLWLDGRLRRFSFAGWGAPEATDPGATVDVLTPPTSIGALERGFAPSLHPSAGVP